MLTPRVPVVLERHPDDPALLRADVRPWAERIRQRHGPEEWVAVLLTHELHRHLGVYSMIGAKMGLRARELLDAGLDDLSVESRAGLRPPLSCMNDGLQVATGASLGRGTIAVDGRDPRPEAWFAARERRLGLRLRSAVRDRVEAGFRAIRERHGGGTAVAEDASRQEAIRLWLELDRREIFEEVPGP